MKIIILRGLPGTGKTTIAHELENKVSGLEVVHLDDFGMKTDKDISGKILKKLSQLIKKNIKVVIIEGVIKDINLWSKLKIFAKENKLHLNSFMLEQPIDKLLDRKPKNTTEDFKRLQEGLNNIEIEDEIIVSSDYIEESVNFILNN